MNYIYKLSFPSAADWEAFKEKHLIDEEGIKAGFTILATGQLQKPPAEDWQPDPDCDPETDNCNGYTLYPDFAVDIKTSEQIDMFNDYLIVQPSKLLRELQGAEGVEIVYKK